MNFTKRNDYVELSDLPSSIPGHGGDGLEHQSSYSSKNYASLPEEAGIDTEYDAIKNPPNDFHASRSRRRFNNELGRKYFGAGWSLVLSSSSLTACVVLLLNTIGIIVIYAAFKLDRGVATLWTGSCEKSASTITGLHLVINILSSVLLAASNYSMQCVSSPTRADVDRAHSKQTWLSIGVPNVRNLFYVPKKKALAWLLLALSSFPLHLLWNSVFFKAQAVNGYVAVSATPEFLTGGSWSLGFPGEWAHTVDNLQELAQQSKLERLENSECMRAYGQNTVSDRSNLIMVVDQPSESSSSVIAAYLENIKYTAASWQPRISWICGQDTNTAVGNQSYSDEAWQCSAGWIDHLASTKASEWIPGDPNDRENSVYGSQQNKTVKYCLSQKTEEKCKIKAIPLFLVIVAICNVLKVIGIVWVLRMIGENRPLMTTGDAVQSFINAPDPNTRGRCLVSKEDYETLFSKSKEWTPRALSTGDLWTGGRSRWGKAVRWPQWWIFYLPAACCIFLAGSFFGPGGIGYGTTSSWSLVPSLGIGEPQPQYSDTSSSSTNSILTVLASANVPQIIISYLYIMYSNILTTMLAMVEWTSYAKYPPKGLRVSAPSFGSEQRKTFFLSLPFRWSVPSIILFTIIHWLTSEMYFLAQIEVYDMQGNFTPSASTTATFFSPLAMLLVVSITSFLLLVLTGLAIFRRYPSNIPLAGCCSASISAACHPGKRSQDQFDPDLSLKRLRWGVVDVPLGEANVGHATFDDGPVGRLLVDKLYN